tara:strand:- start:1331 stop:1519 length:189 start_codon:yes stop_codon:yes gene_type:complete
MVFSRFFSLFFEKNKKNKDIELPSEKDVEDVAKYRLVYNPQRDKYEKILVYNENDLEDASHD